eukprot:SAG31_NODE_467_length_15267_cov_13.792919_2_plen_36_part_00
MMDSIDRIDRLAKLTQYKGAMEQQPQVSIKGAVAR